MMHRAEANAMKTDNERSKGEEALQAANGERATSPVVRKLFSGSLTEMGAEPKPGQPGGKNPKDRPSMPELPAIPKDCL